LSWCCEQKLVVIALGHVRRDVVALVQRIECPFKSDWPIAFCRSPIDTVRKDLLPDLTPVRPTLTLTLKLSAHSTHASATLRAHAIQNVGLNV
jgi:hypothetical protein